MPTGYPRTAPLDRCARKGCPYRVNDPRQQYCSKACFGLASRGRARASQPTGTYQGRPNIHTVNVDRTTPDRPLDYWWMSMPREGFTAQAAQRRFSQDRKAVPAPNWIE